MNQRRSFLLGVSRIGLALVAWLSLLSWSRDACAQELGSKGNLAFSAERLFGLYFDHQSWERGQLDAERDLVVFGLSWQPAVSPLTVPRLGVDYFIDEHLTLGGNLGMFVLGGDGDDTGILFGARVGYALRLSHEIAFWPRGGITFASAGENHVFAINLEGMFTLAPADNWAVLLGPVLDLGLAGESGEDDYSEILFGVMVGMIGWFDV
jgi:hypothetical protein